MSNNKQQNSNVKSKNLFSAYKELDDFIQISLDKYHFVDPAKQLYDSTGFSANAIVSHKSAIPDLVIYNKKFNKNECFYDADSSIINLFPRLKYILKAKPLNYPPSSNNSSQNVINKEKFTSANSYLKSVYSETDNKSSANSNLNKQNNNNIEIKKEEFYGEKLNSNNLNGMNNGNNIANHKDKKFDDFEEDPEWGDIDVNDLKNTKVQFKFLPAPKKEDNSSSIKKTTSNQQQEELLRNNNLEEVGDKSLEKIQYNHTNFNNNSNANFESKDNQNKYNKSISGNNQIIHTFDKNSLFSEDFSMQNLNNNRNFALNNNTLNQQRRGSKNFSPNNNISNIPTYKLKQGDSIKTDLTEQNNLIRAMSSGKELFSVFDSSPSNNKFPQNSNYFNDNKGEKFNQAHEMQMMQNHIINNSGNLLNKFINPNSNFERHQQLEEEIQNFNFSKSNNVNDSNNLSNQSIRNQNNINSIINNRTNFQSNNTNHNLLNPNTISNYYNEAESSQKPIPPFLEDPVFIVTKNLFNAGWLLMNQQNKILASFNSVELLGFLEEEVKSGNNLREFCLSDHQTDMYFNPMQLYEVLKESIPRILETVKKQKEPLLRENNFSNNKYNDHNYDGTNNNINNSNYGLRNNNFTKQTNHHYGNKFDNTRVTFDTSLNSDKRNFNNYNNNFNNRNSENTNFNYNINSNNYQKNSASDLNINNNYNKYNTNFNDNNSNLNQSPLNKNINAQFTYNNNADSNNIGNFSKSSKDLVTDLSNVGINASRIPLAQDFSNLNYAQLFNTSLSTDNNKTMK